MDLFFFDQGSGVSAAPQLSYPSPTVTKPDASHGVNSTSVTTHEATSPSLFFWFCLLMLLIIFLLCIFLCCKVCIRGEKAETGETGAPKETGSNGELPSGWSEPDSDV